jgi:nitrogen fixation protein FixH
MALVLAGVLAAAVSHPDAVLVDDAYRASERYDAALRAATRAAALGLRLELSAAPAPGGVQVAMRLLDAEGREVPAERMRVRRERPTQGGFDAELDARAGADGGATWLALPLPGRWIVEGIAERGGETVVARRIVEVPR